MTVKTELIAVAEDQHAQYPQYRGHWDTWSVGTLRKDIKSRGAVIGVRGENVLVDPDSLTKPDDPEVVAGWRRAGFIVAYFPDHYANGCNASVRARDITIGDQR